MTRIRKPNKVLKRDATKNRRALLPNNNIIGEPSHDATK